ncbi:DUF6502 family protein [Roseomonas sp. OT10]|uniref:DUF6502 family protein n=1 Tax=Roseomonas cutis TaxID=2897332 RepID=UPI001E3B6CBC|nr:DUF6502 family protein [Roseomonas sp. OT10]UFN50959.1 DUF6502 family protein [Roseomonas sp. OT10]
MTSAPLPPSAMPADALMRPLRRLLRPLVRLLIRSGVTFPVLADLLRGLYVEVAARDLLTAPRDRTDSRISLLTGVHRKEIRRQREEEGGGDEVPPIVTLSGQVIARWLGLPAYTDAAGQPLPLPRIAAEGPSFDSLVASVTTDVRARTVLDDWLAQGIVSLDALDRVRLDTEAFLPRQGREEQLYYFARNLHDHLAAASANISIAGQAPFLDRSVHYDRLSPAVAERLEAAGREGAQRLLMAINRLALAALAEEEAAAPAPPAPGAPTRRVNLGVYLYAEDETPDGGT